MYLFKFAKVMLPSKGFQVGECVDIVEGVTVISFGELLGLSSGLKLADVGSRTGRDRAATSSATAGAAATAATGRRLAAKETAHHVNNCQVAFGADIGEQHT